ncbi:MAG TPA: glycosyltransferase [Dehalococcoidia bacterium]|nr:glycosyltransferase [Dehalococcoidia bacterium]
MTRRIAMISEHASPLGALGGVDAGGQNVYVGQVATHLAMRGYEVDVFTRRDNPELAEVQDWRPGVRVVHVPAGPPCFVPKEEMLPCMEDFTSYMLENWSRLGGYDLVHANFWMSGLVALELKRELGVPFVITFHALGRVRRLYQANSDRFPDERFLIEDRIVAEADRIIAECPEDRLDLLRYYDADEAKIAVVPCGFDAEELAPVAKNVARRAAGLAEDEPVILQLGRLVPRKGVDTVIQALARLRCRHDLAARLLIVGGQSEEPDAEKTPEIGRLHLVACEEDVEDLVTFAGRRERDCLRYYYSAADVFVTTPWYEPFGITPLEAMACARPVVGSDVGGIKYSVVHGETGYLVPPNDPDALAERLAELISEPSLATAMGRRGLQRVHEHFPWQRIAGQIAGVYRDLGACTEASRRESFAEEVACVQRGFDTSIDALMTAREAVAPSVVEAARTLTQAFRGGGKLLLCGNGGSASDAQHFAGELVGRFELDGREPLPAIALTSDTAVLTAWANDSCYEDVFARQVLALGRPGDVLACISTSGKSPNVLRALEAARRKGMHCVAITGRDGGPLAGLADTSIVVPSHDTQRIQEVHSLVIHLLCQLVERDLMGASPQNAETQVESRGDRVIAPRNGKRSKVHAA